MKLTRKDILQWIEDLRSGKFNQGQRTLKGYDPVSNTIEYCCLGVLAERHFEFETERKVEDEETSEWYYPDQGPESIYKELKKVFRNQQLTLMLMNDEYNESFKEIADYIESNILPDFKE